MNTDSLRRGNLVQTNQGVYKVHLIGEKHIEVCPFLEKEPFEVKVWEEIRLTEEWLIRFGLKEVDGYFTKRNGFYAFKIKEAVDIMGDSYYHPEKYSWTMFGFVGRIYFVHQLQNLYFELTGEELTLKQ